MRYVVVAVLAILAACSTEPQLTPMDGTWAGHTLLVTGQGTELVARTACMRATFTGSLMPGRDGTLSLTGNGYNSQYQTFTAHITTRYLSDSLAVDLVLDTYVPDTMHDVVIRGRTLTFSGASCPV